ncbi:Hypothetical protein A7982_09453 [Minicystis rosea]|nr:Hypothetical protein A7982_09453 [Minicystis rosea]
MGCAAIAAFGLSTTGCAALISGQHDTSITVDFPGPDTSFWAWNEITLDQDINSVSSATLIGVSLTVKAPEGRDFSFLSSLRGEAVTATSRTPVASLATVPQGESVVVMHIDYLGDLHPLFKDDHTIRIEWTGGTNPAFTDWATPISVEAKITIDVQ